MSAPSDAAAGVWGLTEAQEGQLRTIVGLSACLSLLGAMIIILSIARYRELSKRFFAIRLIFILVSQPTRAAGLCAFARGAHVYTHSRR